MARGKLHQAAQLALFAVCTSWPWLNFAGTRSARTVSTPRQAVGLEFLREPLEALSLEKDPKSA